MTDVTYSVRFVGEGSGLRGMLQGSEDDARDLNRQLSGTSNQTEEVSRSTDRYGRSASNATRETRGWRGALTSLRRVAGPLAGIFAAWKLVSISRDMIGVITNTERLRGSLQTVTGSAAAGAAAFTRLQDFASETPFQLEQSVEAFIKLKSLGLDPSEEALRSYGNTAAAMGKDLSQFIEAVADASTAEFERLKEFGIRAKNEGETIQFTFQGVTTEVKNNSEAIVSHLQTIGDVNFGGAMEDQMERLPGLFSNLKDQVNGLFVAIGDAGLTNAIKLVVKQMIDWVSTTREFAAENATDAIISGFRAAAKAAAFFVDVVTGLKIIYKSVEIAGQEFRKSSLENLFQVVDALSSVKEFFGGERIEFLGDIQKDWIEAKRNIAGLKVEMIDLVNSSGSAVETVESFFADFTEKVVGSREATKEMKSQLGLTIEEMIKFSAETKAAAEATKETTVEVDKELAAFVELTSEMGRLARATQEYVDRNVLAAAVTEEVKEEIKLTIFEVIELNDELESQQRIVTLTTEEVLRYGGAMDTVSGQLNLTTQEIILLSGEMGRVGDVAGQAANDTEGSFGRIDENARELTRSVNRTFQDMFRTLRTEGFEGVFDVIFRSFGRLLDSMLAAWATSGIFKLMQSGGFINPGGGAAGGGGGSVIPGLGSFNLSGGISSALQNAGVEGILAQTVADGAVTGLKGLGAGLIGREISSALFGSKGLGADIGGTVGGGAGFAIGQAFGVGPLGAGIGSFLGSAIGGLFGGGAPEGKINLRTADEDQGFKNAISAASPFGFVGADEEFSKSLKKIAPDFNKRMASLVAGFDERVADFLSETQIDAVGEALRTAPEFTEDVGKKLDETEFGRVLANRAINILEGLNEAVPQILRDAVAGADLTPEEVGDILTKALLPAMEGLSTEASDLVRNFEGTTEQAIAFTNQLIAINDQLPQLQAVFGSQSLETFSGAADIFGGIDQFNAAVSSFVQNFGFESEVLKASVSSLNNDVSESLSELGTTRATFIADFRQAVKEGLTPEDLAAWIQAGNQITVLTGLEKQLTDARSDSSAAISENIKSLGQIVSNIDGELLPANETLLESYRTQYNALTDLVDASTDAEPRIQEISNGLLRLKDTAIDVLQAIEQARADIEAGTRSAVDQITLANLDTEGQFKFHKERAESLRAGIPDLTSPEAVARQQRQIDFHTLQAFGLLGPDAQREQGPSFIKFLEETSEESTDRLDQIGKEVTDNLQKAGDAIVQKFGAAIQPFIDATSQFAKSVNQMDSTAQRMDSAANKQVQAANTPQQVNVSVNSEDSAVGF